MANVQTFEKLVVVFCVLRSENLKFYKTRKVRCGVLYRQNETAAKNQAGTNRQFMASVDLCRCVDTEDKEIACMEGKAHGRSIWVVILRNYCETYAVSKILMFCGKSTNLGGECHLDEDYTGFEDSEKVIVSMRCECKKYKVQVVTFTRAWRDKCLNLSNVRSGSKRNCLKVLRRLEVSWQVCWRVEILKSSSNICCLRRRECVINDIDARKKETRNRVSVYMCMSNRNHMLLALCIFVNYHCGTNEIILYENVGSGSKTLVLNGFDSKVKCKEQSISVNWLTQCRRAVKCKDAVISCIVHGSVRRCHDRYIFALNAVLPSLYQNGVSYEIVKTGTNRNGVRKSIEKESMIFRCTKTTCGMDIECVQCSRNFTVANAPSSSISMRKALKCKHKLSDGGCRVKGKYPDINLMKDMNTRKDLTQELHKGDIVVEMLRKRGQLRKKIGYLEKRLVVQDGLFQKMVAVVDHWTRKQESRIMEGARTLSVDGKAGNESFKEVKVKVVNGKFIHGAHTECRCVRMNHIGVIYVFVHGILVWCGCVWNFYHKKAIECFWYRICSQLSMIRKRRRNCIFDQLNVYENLQQQKVSQFENFYRKSVGIFLDDKVQKEYEAKCIQKQYKDKEHRNVTRKSANARSSISKFTKQPMETLALTKRRTWQLGLSNSKNHAKFVWNRLYEMSNRGGVLDSDYD